MSPTHATLCVVVLWLGIGALTASALHRRGQPAATVAAAVAAWPVLVPLFGAAPTGGPFSGRIVATFAALDAVLRDPVASGTMSPESVERLRDALFRADARLALVDRLLAEEVGDDDARLRQARARAGAEMDAVLRGVAQLRVQVGLLALTSDTAPARGRLHELSERVRALEEMALAPGDVRTHI